MLPYIATRSIITPGLTPIVEKDLHEVSAPVGLQQVPREHVRPRLFPTPPTHLVVSKTRKSSRVNRGCFDKAWAQ